AERVRRVLRDADRRHAVLGVRQPLVFLAVPQVLGVAHGLDSPVRGGLLMGEGQRRTPVDGGATAPVRTRGRLSGNATTVSLLTLVERQRHDLVRLLTAADVDGDPRGARGRV